MLQNENDEVTVGVSWHLKQGCASRCTCRTLSLNLAFKLLQTYREHTSKSVSVDTGIEPGRIFSFKILRIFQHLWTQPDWLQGISLWQLLSDSCHSWAHSHMSESRWMTISCQRWMWTGTGCDTLFEGSATCVSSPLIVAATFLLFADLFMKCPATFG